MRILVVEDHAETRQLVERSLRGAGHEVDGAATLADARARMSRVPYGALVLDWILPDGPGTDLVREMRQRQDATPVLVLTARGDVEDRVAGLDAGADDYLRKPFAVAELLARTRALLRRGARIDSPVITVGRAEIRLEERRVRISGRDVPVTLREFGILELLLRQRGRPVTRSMLLSSLWGTENEQAAASLEVLVSRLRRKVAGAVEGDLIQTHRGVGYSIPWAG